MKTLHITKQAINDICEPFLHDIATNHFQIYQTIGGNVAIVFSRCAGGPMSLLGAYYSSETVNTGEWYPVRWSEEGRFNLMKQSPLDLKVANVTEDNEPDGDCA